MWARGEILVSETGMEEVGGIIYSPAFWGQPREGWKEYDAQIQIIYSPLRPNIATISITPLSDLKRIAFRVSIQSINLSSHQTRSIALQSHRPNQTLKTYLVVYDAAPAPRFKSMPSCHRLITSAPFVYIRRKPI